MATFHCNKCNLSFEDKLERKKEFQDYIYGPCWKYIAYCPQCKVECSKKPEPKPGKAKKDMGCGTGSCMRPACSMFQ